MLETNLSSRKIKEKDIFKRLADALENDGDLNKTMEVIGTTSYRFVFRGPNEEYFSKIKGPQGDSTFNITRAAKKLRIILPLYNQTDGGEDDDDEVKIREMRRNVLTW